MAVKVERLNHYHNLAPELLFENGMKSKVYQYGEARVIQLASVNDLLKISTVTYVIILKVNGDNWFLLYEGDEETKETFHSLDTGLSELLNIKIEITVDLLNVFLLSEPDEELVEKMMAEISQVVYLNLVKSLEETDGNGTEDVDGNGIEEPDAGGIEEPDAGGIEEPDAGGIEEPDGGGIEKPDGRVQVDGVRMSRPNKGDPNLPNKHGRGSSAPKVTKHEEDKLWEEAFCDPFEKNANPSVEQAESIAAKILEVDDTDGASNSILIEAVGRNSTPIVLQLLLLGSKPNQRRAVDGNTALHVAAKNNNKVMVKLLLAFKADPNIKNENNETPSDLAADEEISCLIKKAATLQAETRQYFASNSSLPAERTRSGTYLMSLDGGGIRGFNTITFLIAVEDRMKELLPESAEFHPIQYYFDYIAGTSFGAIAGLSLLYTNHSLRIGKCLVYQILVKVMSSNHIEKMMEKCLRKMFEEKVMSSLKGPPHAIVTTTKCHDDNIKLCLITSYGSNSETGSTDHQVWKAACMSSAAPVFFRPVDGKYCDGGLLANNPTHVALKEISKIEQNCEFGCVLSIGTGTFEDPKIVDCLQYLVWNVPFGKICKKPFQFTKAIKLLTNLPKKKKSDQAAQYLCSEKGWEYHRWSPFLSKNLGLACTKHDVIIDMMYHTEMHILQHPEEIDSIAKCILAKKQAN